MYMASLYQFFIFFIHNNPNPVLNPNRYALHMLPKTFGTAHIYRGSTQLNEPPTKVSGLQREKSWSLFVSPILEKTVKFFF